MILRLFCLLSLLFAFAASAIAAEAPEMLEEKEDAYILGNIQVGAKSGMAVAASDKTE